MKDGFTPVTNQNVSSSVTKNLLKLEKELQQYSRRNNVEILGLPDIFTGDRLTENVVELCNDVGVMIEFKDIEACHRLIQKESNNQLPKRTIVRFVNRRFAEDLLSKRNISSTLDLNKLGFPRGTQIYFNANLYGYYKKLWALLNGCLECIFFEISFDNKKNIIVGLIYRHPHLPINDFCDNF